MRLHEQVSDLKRENKSLKMKVTKLENKNGSALKDAAKEANKKIADLEAQLTASQEHVDVLQQKDDEQQLELADLRLEIHSFQKLIQHTARVTTWKTQP